ncbi:hypothetical protein F4824DRAFT_462718 [Ustulina deusta]|nr:hypothetical protein F4824DRAFT_462718 [Ustulina deusta]
MMLVFFPLFFCLFLWGYSTPTTATPDVEVEIAEELASGRHRKGREGKGSDEGRRDGDWGVDLLDHFGGVVMLTLL